MTGKLPHILLVLDAGAENDILQSFVYANDQVLMQRDGSMYNGTNRYYYLHDRLGSVRMIIDADAAVQNCYTYDPWGNIFDNEIEENVSNPYRFAGYFWDDEIKMANCNARIYDPVIGRFTSRDPVFGRFQEPMTLHAYLYCSYDPVNMVDPTGEWALALGASASGNFTLSNLNFFGWQQRGLSAIAAGIGRSFAKIIAYYEILLPYFTWLTEHMGFGGTAGGAFVVAHNEEKSLNEGWSMGGMAWFAGGGSLSTGAGASATLDIAFSPEAQHIRHLVGKFTELGGSVGTPIPVGFGFLTGGFATSWSKNDEIGTVHLYTGSIGLGTPGSIAAGFGGEIHGFSGVTYVSTWAEN